MSYPGVPDPTSEGYYEWSGYKTYYRITGALSTATLSPLIICHGGPGATMNYTLKMANLATKNRAVVHYESVTHSQGKFWTVDLFLKELNGLIKHLKIQDYYILGQSWGGYLVFSHALQKPKGLKALINADGIADWARFSRGCAEWIEQLPEKERHILQDGIRNGTYDTPAFKEATEYFYTLHVCRTQPYPPEVAEAFRLMEEDSTVYGTMNGPNEFTVIGSMAHESIEDRLHEIKIPVLHATGRYDEVAPSVTESIRSRIKGSELIVYEESSHMPHVEEAEKWNRDIGHWLERQDKAQKAWRCQIQ